MRVKGMFRNAFVAVLLMRCVAVASVEEPMPLNDALFSITISDLHGFLDGAGLVVQQVNPMFNGAMLTQMLGSQFGDPQLTGIAPKHGLAFVMFDSENAVAFIEVEKAQSLVYSNTISSSMISCMYEDGILLVSDKKKNIEFGKKYLKQVKKQLFAHREASLRILGSPEVLIAKNKKEIKKLLDDSNFLERMHYSRKISPEQKVFQMKVLQGEISLFLSILRQIKTVEITLLPDAGSLYISERFVPVKGSSLATFCTAPVVNKPNKLLQSGLFKRGTIDIDFFFSNPDAFVQFVSGELKKIASELKWDQKKIDQLLNHSLSLVSLFTGSGAEVLRFDSSSGIVVDYVMAIKDEAAALKFIKEQVSEKSGVMNLYKGMDIPMKYTYLENARVYKEVKIHQVKMNFDLKKITSKEKLVYEKMGLFNMTYEVAFLNGVLIASTDSKEIESAIDQLKVGKVSGIPLKARAVFPSDASYYIDLNLASYVNFLATVIPPQAGNAQMILKNLSLALAGESIISAGFRKDGGFKHTTIVPGSLIGKLGRFVNFISSMKQKRNRNKEVLMKKKSVK